MSLQSLPRELIDLIGLSLSLRDLLNWSLTNRRFYQICREPKTLRRYQRRITRIKIPVIGSLGTVMTRTTFLCNDCGVSSADDETDCMKYCYQCNDPFCKQMMNYKSIQVDRGDGTSWSYPVEVCDQCR